jgi:signal peptidase I
MPQQKAESVINYFKSINFYDPFMDIYPNTPEVNWTVDNFGPLIVPEKGMTIELNEKNIALYKRAITGYEGKDLYTRDGKVFIDDVETDSYTFEMNYYWMMGDNRHNSQDSRFWGFVPENHVVGKAVFIWLSLDPDYGLFDGKIRWSRLFSVI